MKVRKITYLLISFLLIILIVWLWYQSKSERQKSITVYTKIDFYSNKITIPKEKPQKIVSLSPCNTEILFALGVGDKIVGVTSSTNYPVEAQNKFSVGPYNSPDIEKIIELSPDIVFAVKKFQNHTCIKILENAGIQVIIIEPENLLDILIAIKLISEVIGETEKGNVLCKNLEKKLKIIEQQLSASTPKKVFLEIWDIPLLTVGCKSFLNDLIIRAGGINVAAGNNVDYLTCDIENLYFYNPEIYVVSSHNKNDFRSIIVKKELLNITAIKNNMIFQINDDIIVRPGPRCFDGLTQLAQIIHPEIINFCEEGDK